MRLSRILPAAAAAFLPLSAAADSLGFPSLPSMFFYVPAAFMLIACIAIAAVVIFVRARLREIGSPNTGKKMLHESDFRSIWDLAYLWAGYSRTQQPAAIPTPVLDNLQRLIWAFVGKKITLRTRSGFKLPTDNDYILFFNLNRPRVRLIEMLAQQHFDEAILDSLFVMRSEVLKWCEDDFLTPPAIWAVAVQSSNSAAAPKVVVGRHREEAIDKQVCQAIARTLWDFDAQIHPAHMIKHKAIRKYGNAGQYDDDETIRAWIVEVDPLKGERKPGRPPTVRYALDLENGGFNKDWLADFTSK